jgi:hypothetical protein
MENLALIIAFVIVFGGLGYIIFDILRYFNKKVYP